jgi:hypothetical protein
VLSAQIITIMAGHNEHGQRVPYPERPGRRPGPGPERADHLRFRLEMSHPRAQARTHTPAESRCSSPQGEERRREERGRERERATHSRSVAVHATLSLGLQTMEWHGFAGGGVTPPPAGGILNGSRARAPGESRYSSLQVSREGEKREGEKRKREGERREEREEERREKREMERERDAHADRVPPLFFRLRRASRLGV